MDKRGLKQVVGLGLLVTTGGLVWRIFASSFPELLIITVITGTFLLPVNIAAPKIIGYWFPKKDLPVSMGIYGAAAGLGPRLPSSSAIFFPHLKPHLRSSLAFAACCASYGWRWLRISLPCPWKWIRPNCLRLPLVA